MVVLFSVSLGVLLLVLYWRHHRLLAAWGIRVRRKALWQYCGLFCGSLACVFMGMGIEKAASGRLSDGSAAFIVVFCAGLVAVGCIFFSSGASMIVLDHISFQLRRGMKKKPSLRG